jgi:hypothetical protein
VKKAIPIVILAMVLTASLAFLVGCGGNNSSSSSPELTEQEKLVDNAMRESMKGNYQPLLDLVPPDQRDQYAQMIAQQGDSSSNATIDEAHYKQDDTDATHVVVYFWGTIETPDGQKQSITEDQAQSIPLMQQDGQWYIDFAAEAQSQQSSQGSTP